jgi:hypothetical protein
MPLVIPAGYSEVVVQISSLIPGKVNSFSFGVNDTPGGASQAQITSWLSTAAAGNFRHALYSQYQVVGYEMRDATTSVFVPLGVAGNGVAAGLMPPGVSPLLKKQSGLIGRANRGRMYWPGCLAEADVNNDGTLPSAVISSLTTDAVGLITKLHTVSKDVYLLHNSALAPTLVTTIQCQGTVATQRRRQR